ncbi:KaiC/GvpD/RAD55 family RecA-like ATPase [Methanohalophilus levihalophilus]|uniref:RAD55 family ATPase n=1 Tax=Methanohalophilus levihalophilus TaxID=1431282 RepID=UPI001AE7D39E|nr:RAD55 family ATPase [Methanohalophilus levihalophilus]MBP2029450.1 KaiC/GvpD/RAD55 family RecA-like ATPase [Methanohalophilus levihalophilus]
MVLAGIGIKKLPSSSVILIEEDLGTVKSLFVQKNAEDMQREDKQILYLSTTRSKKEVYEEMSFFDITPDESKFTILGNFRDHVAMLETFGPDAQVNKKYHTIDSSLDINQIDICIFDTFSFIFLGESFETLVKTMESLTKISRKNDMIFLLTLDSGVLDPHSENIIRAMADGIIQFKTSHTGNKVGRYLNIPKMKNNLPLEKIIPFKVSQEGIIIDVRERVG